MTEKSGIWAVSFSPILLKNKSTIVIPAPGKPQIYFAWKSASFGRAKNGRLMLQLAAITTFILIVALIALTAWVGAVLA